MDLILIRHGLPFTITGADGPADPPLTDAGHEQAARMTAWLEQERIDVLYCSPLKRAVQTAEPLARQRRLEAIVRDGLAELDRHHADYVPLEELRKTDYEEWRKRMKDGWYGPGDPLDFQRYVVETIEAIVEENPGRRAAIVCHGGVINAWGSHVLKLNEVFFFQPDYTSINRFAAARSGVRTVLSLNEAAHLRRDVKLAP